VNQFEEPFEARLEDLARDARAASRFVYTELTLHHFFGSDFEVRDRIETHAGFWNGLLAAQQAAGFIALGRLYDQQGRDHTIPGLLKHAQTYPGLFCEDALLQRKVAGGMSPEQAQEFARGTFRATSPTFEGLAEAFEPHRKVYVDRVEPIRDTVFAHAGQLSRAARDEMFTKLFVRELEQMVVFPLALHRVLFHLYFNGSTPTLESPPTVVPEILRALPGNGTSTWEHLHVVKDTARMIVWLRRAPVPERQIDDSTLAALMRALELEPYGLKPDDYETEADRDDARSTSQ